MLYFHRDQNVLSQQAKLFHYLYRLAGGVFLVPPLPREGFFVRLKTKRGFFLKRIILATKGIMNYQNIIFDLDSTLVAIEGLDWLANRKGVGAELAIITAQAMNGQIPQREAMRRKLAMIRPSLSDLVELGREYVERTVPGAKELVSRLQQAGQTVWIITGNFQPAVGILASSLGVPLRNVIASELAFDEQGEYASLDLEQPLVNNFGKARVIKELRISSVVMVGDGVTDLETKPVVDLFIGYGGVISRPKVVEHSELYFDNPNISGLVSLVQCNDALPNQIRP